MPDVWEELARAREVFWETLRTNAIRRGGGLCCVECGRTDEAGERGWRTYLTIDDELATYCGDCAEAEFDG